jgi:small subunit ribosomal protein S13
MYFLKVKLDTDKSISSAFRAVYGLGCYKTKKIIAFLGYQKHINVKEVRSEQLLALEKFFEFDFLNLEMELYRKEYYNIKKLIDVGCYRGFCHKNGLPVYGQRTHTNAKTQKKLYGKRLELKTL